MGILAEEAVVVGVVESGLQFFGPEIAVVGMEVVEVVEKEVVAGAVVEYGVEGEVVEVVVPVVWQLRSLRILFFVPSY